MTRPQNVRWSSIDAYRAPEMAVRITAEQRRIVDVLARRGHGMGGDWTRREIAQETGMQTASVSARVHELIAAGAVVEVGRRFDAVTGRHVHALALVWAGRQ